MIRLQEIAPDRVRPLTRQEYDRMIELGLFDEDEKVELLRGTLVTVSPQGARHAEAISRLTEILAPAVVGRARLRVQLPLAVSDDSEPEPDIAVVARGSYRREHPGTALLVVEVAHSSARKDRALKAAIYAENGIPEYWLVDVGRGWVEVRTEPVDGRYQRVERHGRKRTLAPRAFPDVVVPVEALLG